MEVETSRSSPPEHSPSADQGAPRATPADAHAKAPPAAVSAPDSSTAGTKGRLAETGCAAVAAPGASAQQLAPMGSGEPATESSESDGDQPRSRSPPVSPLADPLSETPCTAAAVGDTRNGKRKRPATAAPDHLEQQPPGGAAAQPGSVATSAHGDVGTSTAERPGQKRRGSNGTIWREKPIEFLGEWLSPLEGGVEGQASNANQPSALLHTVERARHVSPAEFPQMTPPLCRKTAPVARRELNELLHLLEPVATRHAAGLMVKAERLQLQTHGVYNDVSLFGRPLPFDFIAMQCATVQLQRRARAPRQAPHRPADGSAPPRAQQGLEPAVCGFPLC